MKLESIVDNIWKCGCGSLNSPYNKKCGGCGIENRFRVMDGNEIIERLKTIRQDVSDVNLKNAMQKIDYLCDDIFMYKNNSL